VQSIYGLILFIIAQYRAGQPRALASSISISCCCCCCCCAHVTIAGATVSASRLELRHAELGRVVDIETDSTLDTTCLCMQQRGLGITAMHSGEHCVSVIDVINVGMKIEKKTLKAKNVKKIKKRL